MLKHNAEASSQVHISEGFRKWVMVPPQQPFTDRWIVPYKRAILGYIHSTKPPYEVHLSFRALANLSFHASAFLLLCA